MTRPGIEPRPPDYEADALLIEPTHIGDSYHHNFNDARHYCYPLFQVSRLHNALL